MASPRRLTDIPLASRVVESGQHQPGPNAVHFKAGRLSAIWQRDKRRVLSGQRLSTTRAERQLDIALVMFEPRRSAPG
jgi:hypothetical protein